MNDIDSSNDKYTSDSNDKYSNVKYTNDSILTLFFFLVKSLQILSANTLILTATMKHISTNRFQKSIFLVFCNFLLYFHLFNFFPYPYVFFLRLYIHIHLVLGFAFIYLLTLFFLHSLFGYTQMILEYLKHLIIFCSICLYVRYSYIKKSNHNLIYPFS